MTSWQTGFVNIKVKGVCQWLSEGAEEGWSALHVLWLPRLCDRQTHHRRPTRYTGPWQLGDDV